MLVKCRNIFCQSIRRKMECLSWVQSSSVSSSKSKYEEAVTKLNLLQSNAAVLEKIRKERDRILHGNIAHVEECLNKVGVAVEDLDKLRVIHISGTKGKGSTSAFCESILRSYGYKTGFYSSPHLVEARERIRIAGQPISYELFTSYFWQIYSKLWFQKKSDDDMPAYFKFLTVMAYYVFLKEKVDVAIIEVGIGGQYDSTNVIKSPYVCGVTSLGLDHVNILGDTIEKIARQKAGIFKQGVAAFTAPQPKEALAVLSEWAQHVGNPLYVVPSIENYNWGGKPISLSLSGSVQSVNASLAIQLAVAWLNIKNGTGIHTRDIYDQTKDKSDDLKMAPSVSITGPISTGLQNCQWPGRNQILRRNPVIYFVDGAHTDDSIKACKQWFQEASKLEAIKASGSVYRILMFNLMGDREPEVLLAPFVRSNFNLVIFCPNFAHVSQHGATDQNAVASPWNFQMDRCSRNNYIWQNMQCQNPGKKPVATDAQIVDENHLNEEDVELFPSKETIENDSFIPSLVFPSICDAVSWISQGKNHKVAVTDDNGPLIPAAMINAKNVHVLVTGSLHLVGGFLSVLHSEATHKASHTSDNHRSNCMSINKCRQSSPGTP